MLYRPTLLSRDVTALQRAVIEAEGWRGSLTGDPDPSGLIAFDAFIKRAKEAMRKIRVGNIHDRKDYTPALRAALAALHDNPAYLTVDAAPVNAAQAKETVAHPQDNSSDGSDASSQAGYKGAATAKGGLAIAWRCKLLADGKWFYLFADPFLADDCPWEVIEPLDADTLAQEVKAMLKDRQSLNAMATLLANARRERGAALAQPSEELLIKLIQHEADGWRKQNQDVIANAVSALIPTIKAAFKDALGERE